MQLNQFIQINLFWRTFVLLMLLLLVSSVTWLLTFRSLETKSHINQSAHQISSVVDLVRSSLTHADPAHRAALTEYIQNQKHLAIRPQTPSDLVLPYQDNRLQDLLETELQLRLGQSTLLYSNVNNEPGLWVSFTVDKDVYWLRADLNQIEPLTGGVWLFLAAVVVFLSLLGAAIIAGLINRPLRLLSQAADHVRIGNFAGSRLDESLFTKEVNNAFRGFNQMTDQLSKVESDRSIMLAGISHDLRTPLARLRLETELSVADANAKREMSADIEQINSIIGKFLDYARPNFVDLRPLLLAEVVEQAMQTALTNAKDAMDLLIEQDISPNLKVMADPVELQRVLANLIENARRYGKAPVTMAEFSTLSAMHVTHDDASWSPTLIFDHTMEVAHIHIHAKIQNEWVVLSIHDQGSGVPPNVLEQLKTPFFRVNNARSDIVGSGLGLSIVEKTVQNMQGKLYLSNMVASESMTADAAFDKLSPYCGFLVELHLKHANS